MKRFASISLVAVSTCRHFFGKGWDNASLDTIYSCMLRKPEVNDRVRSQYASTMDPRDADVLRRLGEVAKENKTFIRVFLPPHLGDPHRLLKCYSLMAYPILDDKGGQLKVEMDGHHLDAFADPDDDYAKVVIPHIELVEYLAKSLLETMKWEATPRGAASLLESLYRGADIPDHVFQTPAVIERIDEFKDGNKVTQ
ncbi:putative cytochrome c oxidase subunit V [Trypanosoma cruzi]|uniref:Cytochrome c oxidase subunit V, putative n=2 Tax=Trypanosoma cruzi TaxID=5693 RepID=Q4D214_TRYCC|nr:cytochrome c oxidase subunit V, putative [Trypanosoma cruzi]XP_816256.1 cytochrome c oxidase subunit V, putative [Trypanosoma cruzi]PBJ74743.1 cytochrome c oxidase subunit V [Trypanosoma cruzi cruzi]EAN86560.1 cytochrome c oxidase subunit V, putative [Trypanosoma cruzi]EAN94405.1 cytochrome c oxidase subunit V, putative [Trypanosoma cruzi]KAF8280389.1 putative cytochrome c oxidase subunit V [Trypanosoma cruzi]KAF8296563.1 putative cytochrome c oxidase subunit V [Trypanosoma cruzi]|eukprot:XP_808411.1 cytochrome c oxidase subunit V [Trypanosoma cruzi strain CL Brener]